MSVEKILNTWGKTITHELQVNLDKLKKNASGNLSQSIKITTKVLGDSYSFKLFMPDYYQWVDEGRRAGKYPNIGAIREWLNNNLVRSKLQSGGFFKKGTVKKGKKGLGIDLEQKTLNQLIGGIAGKIKRDGIKPSYFFSDVFNDESVLELKNNIRVALQKDITIEITKE